MAIAGGASRRTHTFARRFRAAFNAWPRPAVSKRRSRRRSRNHRPNDNPRRPIVTQNLHTQARRDWGYGRNEHLSNDDLIAEKYRGIRPAFGYPACPDHTDKRTLFSLLDAERVGIELTESCAMTPAASVSGLYFASPHARYFAVGRLGTDQVADYARRKRITTDEAERWLTPYLAYEAAPAGRC